MPSAGIEPTSSRPQRDILTTGRQRPKACKFLPDISEQAAGPGAYHVSVTLMHTAASTLNIFVEMRKLPLSKRSGTPEKGKRLAKQRSLIDQVEQCDRNGQYELDISKLDLSVWPNETVLVPGIKIQNAENNKITTMPNLEHFRALTVLNLSRNKLEDVNELRFGSIVALKQINLSRNVLTSLPTDITRLTLLEELNISYNKLTVLPDGIGMLRSLHTLDASYNLLTDVGDSLETVNSLQHLNLLGNEQLNFEELGIRTRRLHEKV
jgi:Leucine-rich repeat (LRR) protein